MKNTRTPSVLLSLSLLAGSLVALPTLTACADDKEKPTEKTPTEKTKEQPKTIPATPIQPATPAATPKADAPKAEAPVESKMVYVTMETSKGTIVLELNGEKAPISTENFVAYVNKGQYNGTIFHRVINNFMIQGGGFDANLSEKTTDKPIKNEWQNGLKNVQYSLAMARTAVPDSATCQFYINVKDNGFLDQPRGGAAYAVFGKVVAGFEVVDAIKAVPTGVKNGMGDVPVEAVVINAATVVAKEDAEALIKQMAPKAATPEVKPEVKAPATPATPTTPAPEKK
jgi:peptidyl-prolyl cis-trans isomerase A (cyclophilin A)/peptidyl-prolyl cis-trans isomerase B (cyclophilin B)